MNKQISFCSRCCYTCANEKEVEWQKRIEQNVIQGHYDEESTYLKSIQQCLANIPISLYHLLGAINQSQPHLNKRWVRLNAFINPKTCLTILDIRSFTLQVYDRSENRSCVNLLFVFNR